VRHWLEAARHGLGRWRSGWPVGRTAIIVLATLLSAGVAYAAVSALVGSGGRSPSAASKAPAWLGVEMASFALGGGFPSGGGALVTNVTPGSPAGVAGLEPGDLITQIGNRAIATPADVNATLAGMHAGDHVEIQYQRGPFADSAEITLTARPAGGP
jgi:S1-C subfamily serine protease